MPKASKSPADYILPLYINGLSGRMLRLPPPAGKKREVLLIAGQHTSIERIFGVADYLNRYGGVTSPDLPGFGGMEPFYKIGEKPTLDVMADYLAAFIKLRYKNKQLTIIAVSYGFSVVTRMLQRYPEITKKTSLLISISGIVNQKDFRWKRHNFILLHGASWILSQRIPAFLAKNISVYTPVMKTLLRIAEKKHPKLKAVSKTELNDRIDFEMGLWKANDFRTWLATCRTMFTLELSGKHIDLPVHHIAVDDDHYFDDTRVEQHMRKIYTDFFLVKTKLPAHAPTILATPKDVAPFVPPKIRLLLSKDPTR